MKQAGSASDPLWYKDAIIYELHVRAFADSNSDGIGDFAGLMQKLDYLQDLGVTCIWLLPFFPSPLRDDGYDIADYMHVHPDYGTVEDFRAFLDAAHERSMQVMIELVINHTSDQHPWFQAARHAAPGSPEHEFYVWNSTDHKYSDARIIFTDSEKSNWTYDAIAKEYFWHRFFSHQPDLNFDNPAVLEEVLKVMRFWLDMGVDALRMDAIPYLVERDGTNCENLPETHAIIKRIRAAIDDEYSNRVILAEANQWPSDVRPYFGEGDECTMAFHFPLMPRMYMALRQEDRLPITEIMAQTPEIPESCQWALFLRNHDELTLEMVTQDERDYMYLAYSADPRMRINIGIRRRLAPLLDNNRRRIELLVSLLLSFPGTPIIYYGDEIGMGDNIYLGDRNGVRTPMQWNADRNAGFSRAVPARLYSPVIMDPIWGYQAINVESQLSDQSSLLHWVRNMIALRKLFQVFGRGSQEFLAPANNKVLAYIRRYGDEKVLCVANLSRFAQPVALDLSEFEGMVPVEMLGYVYFPPIGKQPYAITLSPYAFLWLELQPAMDNNGEDTNAQQEPELQLLSNGWESILAGPGLESLQQKLLPAFIAKQRWFGGKSRELSSLHVFDWVALRSPDAAFVLIEVSYKDGGRDLYAIPVAASFGEAADRLRIDSPEAVIAKVSSHDGEGVLHGAIYREDVCQELLAMIAEGRALQMRSGTLEAEASHAFVNMIQPGHATEGHEVQNWALLHGQRSLAEQSNTSILYGDKLIMKLYRRLEQGENPDVEIGRFLTDTAHFERIAPFYGSVQYVSKSGERTTLAMLQRMIASEGDGWQWTLGELSRYYERCAKDPFNPEEQLGQDPDDAFVLGLRTGEMHAALATPTEDPAFASEPFTIEDIRLQQDSITDQAEHALHTLKTNFQHLAEDHVEQAALLLSRQRSIMQRIAALARQAERSGVAGERIRIHGDYHLGQVLRVQDDYVILDFEGEPARSLLQRRTKQPPLKDVAGMLRSFSYAAYAALQTYQAGHAVLPDQALKWAHVWEQASAASFLRGYRQAIATARMVTPIAAPPAGATDSSAEQGSVLLDIFLLEKAFYELLYEINNRPAWAHIPIAGILALTQPERAQHAGSAAPSNVGNQFS